MHSDEEFQIVCGLGDTPACHKIFSKYNSFLGMLEENMMTFTEVVPTHRQVDNT